MSNQQRPVISPNAISRWWEYYFFRYFIGTITGVACVLYLKNCGTSNIIIKSYGDLSEALAGLGKASADLSKELAASGKPPDSAWNTIISLGCAGFVYAFLGNAPWQLFHQMRRFFLPKKADALDKKKRQWLQWLYMAWNLGFWGTFIEAAILIAWGIESQNIFLWMIPEVAVCLCLVIVVAWSRLAANNAYEHSSLMLKNLNEGKIALSSYRELLEHGNAYTVVLMQIFLTVILAHWDGGKTVSVFQFSVCSDKLLMVYLVIWIGLGALCRLMAQRAERRTIIKLLEEENPSPPIPCARKCKLCQRLRGAAVTLLLCLARKLRQRRRG